MSLLKIHQLETGYEKKQVIYGLSAEVPPNHITALIGPNGAGKSTVLKAVCGMIPVWNGEISLNGEIVSDGATPAQNVTRGISYLPQGNRIFPGMTVLENLEIGSFQLIREEARDRIEGVLRFFPMLKDRIRQDAGTLSGGEQQMVALARALLLKPKLLMLDEPSLGLSPNVMRDVFDKIVELKSNMGLSILVVEQKVREILSICDTVYSLKLGAVVFSGNPSELKENTDKLRELFL